MRRAGAAALAAVTLGGLSASAGGTTQPPAAYRILLVSDRDGGKRPYSVLPDGSQLTPLLRSGIGLEPAGRSADGSTVAYTGPRQAIYLSRADGTKLRRLVRKGAFFEGFSPDARRLAFLRHGIWVIGTDGRGLRRMTSYGDDEFVDWAPDGRSFAFSRYEADGSYSVIVQPLRGRRRVLARTEAGNGFSPEPSWSADGRWLAYLLRDDTRKDGLWVVRRNGTQRRRLTPPDSFITYAWSPAGSWIADYDGGADEAHKGLWIGHPDGTGRRRVTPEFAEAFAWSPDGKKLAFLTVTHELAIVAADGSSAAQIAVPVYSNDAGYRFGGREGGALAWSPDGRRLAFAASESPDHVAEIWTVGSDLRGLRQITTEGRNGVIAWTRLAPALPPARPLEPVERVTAADVVATAGPVRLLSADGPSVAFVSERRTPTDCDHVALWKPDEGSLRRVGPPRAPCDSPIESPPRITALALAGSRVAWSTRYVHSPGRERSCDFTLEAAMLPSPAWAQLSWEEHLSCSIEDRYRLRGDGDVLVFNADYRLVRIGTGTDYCTFSEVSGSICSTLRNGDHYGPVESVSGRLIALGDGTATAVVDDLGRLVRVFEFDPDPVDAARLDGGSLVVSRSGKLEAYDVATGARQLSRPVPAGFLLTDVDGGVAILVSGDTVMLLRLADGRSFALNPGSGPTLADLEPPGLSYSYAAPDGTGRVVFMPRAEVDRRLGR